MDGEYLMFKWEQFEDTKVVIRSRKSQKDIQNKDQNEKSQKDKQRYMQHYTEN